MSRGVQSRLPSSADDGKRKTNGLASAATRKGNKITARNTEPLSSLGQFNIYFDHPRFLPDGLLIEPLVLRLAPNWRCH